MHTVVEEHRPLYEAVRPHAAEDLPEQFLALLGLILQRAAVEAGQVVRLKLHRAERGVSWPEQNPPENAILFGHIASPFASIPVPV